MRLLFIFLLTNAMSLFGNPVPLMAQFTTIINLPPAPNIGNGGEIGSGAQLNLGPGGLIGTDFHSWSGSEINISGGEIGNGLHVEQDATANISGGITGGISAHDGSTVTVSGGAIGDMFRAYSQSSVSILGGEFLIDGQVVEGLMNEGDEVTVQVPFETLLTGVLADGTPFAFVVTKGLYLDFGPYNTFTLVASELPNPGPSVIDVSMSPAPVGARNGQTLIVRDGAQLRKNFTAIQESTILLQEGGVVQDNLEIVSSTVNVTGGSITLDFDALAGSTVNISGGTAHEVVLLDSALTVTGGVIGHDYTDLFIGGAVNARQNSTVNMSGGIVGDGVSIGANSVLNVTGGSIGDYLNALPGSTVNISGGVFGESFDASSDSEINIFGTEFYLNGVKITDLAYDLQTPLLARDQVLSGTLADGTPFEFLLSTNRFDFDDYFHPNALLTLTLVYPTADFDNDGDVDGRDFLAWQRGTSSNPLSAGDLADWQANYGTGSLSASTAVPEPTGLVMLGLAVVIALRARLRLAPPRG